MNRYIMDMKLFNGKKNWLCSLVFVILLNATVFAQGKKSSQKSTAINLQEVIELAYNNAKGNTGGKNANYIPYLANVPSNLFGIALLTADGKMYTIGDTKFEFGIESISKVFVLAQAMQLLGPDTIQQRIGVGATGLPFNSVMAIELEGNKPVSPIVNGGAMATNSLIKGKDKTEQFNKILNYFSKLANRKLGVIDELYRSEAETNQHNQAIAMLLSSYGRMWANPLDACDSYTKQCSVGTTTEDLAVMAGVLANGGVNPLSSERLLDQSYVPKVLAVMGMEGLYEGTGDFMYTVGLPAKSGVGGGIIAIAPGKYAIAAFAPPLDGTGNSIKAQQAIKTISEKLKLNVFLAQ